MAVRGAPRRRTVRLKDHDYASPGAYFVTICTLRRELFFDKPEVRRLAEACWREIPAHVPNVELDEWVVMPNHIHGIIVIADQCQNVEGRGVQSQRDASQLNAPTTNDIPLKVAAGIDRRRDPEDPFSVISPRRNTLPVIVRTYKAAVTAACRGAQLDFTWQRGFYEHVVRHQRELDATRRYIRENPLQWALDRDNPANGRPPAASADDYLKDNARVLR